MRWRRFQERDAVKRIPFPIDKKENYFYADLSKVCGGGFLFVY